MKNTIYPKLKEYIKQHHGWNGDELKASSEWQEYLNFQKYLSSFDGKKVKIKFCNTNDWMTTTGEKIGRIKAINDESFAVRFFEGRKTRRYYNLDAGLFDGWFATLIPLEIEEL